MKKYLLGMIVFSALNGAGVYAENEKGNGGDAYRIGTKVYAFDLVEEGLETNPYFNPQVKQDTDTLAILAAKVPVAQAFPRTWIAKKMGEIKVASPLYYTMLKLAMQHFTYRFISADLADINDAVSVLNLDPNRLIQAAVRDGNTIRFNKIVFQQMDAKNQTALFFHELNYSMQMIWGMNYRLYMAADSDATRALTSKLFDSNLTQGTLETTLINSLTDYKNLKESYSTEKNYVAFAQPLSRFVDPSLHELAMSVLKGSSTLNELKLPSAIRSYDAMTESGTYLIRIREVEKK